jgi:hypothetical protein
VFACFDPPMDRQKLQAGGTKSAGRNKFARQGQDTYLSNDGIFTYDPSKDIYIITPQDRPMESET